MAVKIKGGNKLRQALADLAKKVEKGGHVNVGFFPEATYPDGTPVAYIASVQEFGGTVEVPEHQTEIYRSVGKDGSFNKGGKFVRRSKSNFATTHTVPAHVITIPARPFMRNTVSNNQAEWGKALGTALAETGFSVEKSLNVMGRVMSDQMRDEIKSVGPDNKPSTIRKKGFNRPLIDTGRMFQSVTHEVKDGPSES